MRIIAEEIVAAVKAVEGPTETYYLVNPKDTQAISYPYAVFDYSYTPSDATDGSLSYDVSVEFDLFHRGGDALELLDAEQAIVLSLQRYRAMRTVAWNIARLEQSLGVPTQEEGLYRRQLQFVIRMTLRKE